MSRGRSDYVPFESILLGNYLNLIFESFVEAAGIFDRSSRRANMPIGGRGSAMWAAALFTFGERC